MTQTSKEAYLARRPKGEPVLADLQIREVELPPLADGDVLVSNLWMSVDPYMRLYMSEYSGAHEPLPVNSTLHGGAVGIVKESRSPALPVGSYVLSQSKGWRDNYVDNEKALELINPDLAPVQYQLGLLGRSGMTAYSGMCAILDPKPGDKVFVSGAAGSVGIIALQLAKIRGATVIGSSGSTEKEEWLKSTFGLDSFINYRTDDIREKLSEFAPDGLDLYFDNVGGGHLEAAIDSMKLRGKIALSGAVAQYNLPNYRGGPGNFFAIIERGLHLVGFTASQHAEYKKEFTEDMARLEREGSLIWKETVIEGLDNAPAAFLDLLAGKNLGKMLVKISAD